MIRVEAAPTASFSWLLERIGYAPTTDFRAIQAVTPYGRICGMVGFDHWMPNSCQMHVALDTPIATRALLHPAFSYPFEEAGKTVALGFVPGSRARSLRLARSLGFTEAWRVRDGWERGVDLVAFEMRKENCRWIRKQKGGLT